MLLTKSCRLVNLICLFFYRTNAMSRSAAAISSLQNLVVKTDTQEEYFIFTVHIFKLTASAALLIIWRGYLQIDWLTLPAGLELLKINFTVSIQHYGCSTVAPLVLVMQACLKPLPRVKGGGIHTHTHTTKMLNGMVIPPSSGHQRYCSQWLLKVL